MGGLKKASRLAAVAMLSVILCASPVQGGVSVIGQLQPAQLNDGFYGLTFDNDPNPLVLDVEAWNLERLDKINASVLSQTTSNPVVSAAETFVFDPTTGAYFTIDVNNSTLVRIDPLTLNHTTVGPLGTSFNFMGLAVDAGGNLWLGVDHNSQAQLWSVDKNTGAAGFVHNIFFGGGLHMTTMTVASDGTFYIAAQANFFNDGGEGIYRVNPLTGSATFVTSTNPFLVQLTVALSQDPATARFYGIREDRNMAPATYSLVEVTGIPEPASATLMLLASLGLIGARRRK